ncbi:hypothetical protein [Hydrogenimonas sp.]
MRRGIVLFITLGILLLLSSIIFLFLQQSGTLKKSVGSNIDVVQANLLLSDMSGFLKLQNFTQDDVFYGSGIPVALDLDRISGTIALSSAQSRIDINALLGEAKKSQKALQALLQWMDDIHVKDPSLLMALMMDTLDSDLYERARGSEIRLQKPWFQNGTIANSRAMEEIVSTYRTLSGDNDLTLQTLEETFGYEDPRFDLNYATIEQLRLLYPDFPSVVIEKIASHETRFAKPEDIAIDETSRLQLPVPHFGITPTFKSDTLAIHVKFSTTHECSGAIAFWMGLKNKKITHISLSPVVCK